MQGVILAAGKGTRLGALTATRSKAMMPVAGKPIVERVADMLVSNGVRDLILVVGPDDREIMHYFCRETALDAEVRFVYQTERRGMAHALQVAAPLLSEDFVLSACDNLVDEVHVGRLVAALQGAECPNAVLTLMPVTPDKVRSTGIVAMDGPWITRIVEKPTPEQAPSNMSSLPLYAFARRLLDYLPLVQPSPRGEYELQDAIQMLIERDGRVTGVVVDRRMTLTDADDLLALNRAYLQRPGEELPAAAQDIGSGTHLIAPLRIDQGATVGSGCTIGPNVYIERDCRIGDGAVLRDAVVMRGAVVPAHAVVEHQVIA